MESTTNNDLVEKTKSQIVGRVWVENDTLTGYVIVGVGQIIKFAGNLSNVPCFLFKSKKN